MRRLRRRTGRIFEIFVRLWRDELEVEVMMGGVLSGERGGRV